MARVLIVEDFDLLYPLMSDLIEQAGHSADCVKTKAAATALLGPGSHSLVIADVRLPDGTGHEIAALANDFGIKAILMSGHPEELQTMTSNQVVHLAKPFQVEEFERIVAEQLGDAQASAQQPPARNRSGES